VHLFVFTSFVQRSKSSFNFAQLGSPRPFQK